MCHFCCTIFIECMKDDRTGYLVIMIPFYGGVSKLNRSPCILSTRSIKAVTQTKQFDKSGI